MLRTYGNLGEEFLEWLERAKHVLPGATSIWEARKMWAKQQEELKYEKDKENGKSN